MGFKKYSDLYKFQKGANEMFVVTNNKTESKELS